MILNDQLNTESAKTREEPLNSKSNRSKTNQNYTNINTAVGINKNLKIFKSYYKKDAIESVTKSFLTIDETYYKANQNCFKDLSKLSIGAISIATITTNSDNLSDTSSSYTSSCSNFANNKFQK